MMQVKEVKEWLDTLKDTEFIAIDEGGLSLENESGKAYIEVGGWPTGDGPPPYDAATATGMYDRGDF